MIHTVIFDFGQVLCRFEPRELSRPNAQGESDLDLLSAVVFDRLYWDRLDAGTVSRGEILEDLKSRLPARLMGAAADVLENWIYRLPEVEGMRDLVCDLKEKGFRCYYLSNISRHFAAHLDANPILSEFDGGICSAVEGVTKPHREIFELLCTRYGIDPTEAIFVDDSRKNIDGAAAFGLRTYLFDGDAAALREVLSKESGVKL